MPFNNGSKTWKKIYGIDYINDTQNYDLIINTDKLTVKQTTDIVMQMLKAHKGGIKE